MTINEALETIKGERWIACQEKYQEAMNLIETTMHKYQKITEIMSDLNGDFYGSYLKDRQALEKMWIVMISEGVKE